MLTNFGNGETVKAKPITNGLAKMAASETSVSSSCPLLNFSSSFPDFY
jgi:hypothetical protein